MRIVDWNQVAMIRHIWNLTHFDDNSIWIKWAKRYLLNKMSLWEAKIPNSSSWV